MAPEARGLIPSGGAPRGHHSGGWRQCGRVRFEVVTDGVPTDGQPGRAGHSATGVASRERVACNPRDAAAHEVRLTDGGNTEPEMSAVPGNYVAE